MSDRDSSAVENALVDKLRADATLKALMPDGVFFGEAGATAVSFVLVTLDDEHDEGMFGERAYEDHTFLVKAISRKDTNGAVRKAAARIDELLDPKPPARATLTIDGYRLMVMRRIKRVRYADPDQRDLTIVWQHRGGQYQVMVYPTAT